MPIYGHRSCYFSAHIRAAKRTISRAESEAPHNSNINKAINYSKIDLNHIHQSNRHVGIGIAESRFQGPPKRCDRGAVGKHSKRYPHLLTHTRTLDSVWVSSRTHTHLRSHRAHLNIFDIGSVSLRPNEGYHTGTGTKCERAAPQFTRDMYTWLLFTSRRSSIHHNTHSNKHTVIRHV